MADKSPDSILTENIGSVKITIATFAGTTIDDNDTWTPGIKSALLYGVEPTIDGPNDFTIDGYDNTTGSFTFGSDATQTGKVWVMHKGY